MSDAAKVDSTADMLCVIRKQDAQALLNYLSGQPCGQVYQLVTMLLNLQPLTDKAPDVSTAPPAPPPPPTE